MRARLDDQRLSDLAARYGTPLYVFDEAAVRSRCRDLTAAIPYPDHRIRYAMKALSLQAILKIVRDEGLWIDASSINEVRRALRAGFAPEAIYYTGEGATAAVYAELVAGGVLVNCTSLDQLRLLGRVAPGTACSVRLNPGAGHGETRATTTGGPASKHGIWWEELGAAFEVAAAGGLTLIGAHAHVGSGADLRAWLDIAEDTLRLARAFTDLAFVNLGGGFPVVYDPARDQPMPLAAWGAEVSGMMAAISSDLGRPVRLVVEPGRFVVAECGYLLAEVQAVKSTPDHSFVIVGTGMNHNPRPALYGSYHPIRFVRGDGRPEGPLQPYVIAGYLCESGDLFTVTADGTPAPRRLPEIRVGDLMVMTHVGAYAHPMRTEYNAMDLPASVLIDAEGRDRLIERRGTLEDQMRRELEADQNPAQNQAST